MNRERAMAGNLLKFWFALTAAALLSSCAPAPPGALPDGSSIKVGLVFETDASGQAFNPLARQGILKASQEMGFQTDFEKDIDAFAAEGCQVIIAGPLSGEALAAHAKNYPHIQFAIVDNAVGGLANVTSLMFAEDQLGFLAGVVAGGLSKSGFVASISSKRTTASELSIMNFHAGAAWRAGPELKIMNNYINVQTANENVPSFTDSTQGQQTALRLMGQGADVVFAVGGRSVSGVLLAARQSHVQAIDGDSLKNIDVAVYNYLKTVADGSVRSGIVISRLEQGGVGLERFPPTPDGALQKAIDGIKNGSIKTQ